MPAISTAEAIVLAIHSAIRLGRNIQKAYANSLRARSIVLPLPDFDSQADSLNAQRFFDKDGQFALAEIEDLAKLHQANRERALSEEEEERYVEYYVTLERMRRQDSGTTRATEAALSMEDVLSLLRVRQWARGESPQHSPLQLVAGTLVEIGIDYFANVPGALNLASTQGKLVQHFLQSLDRIEFAETDDLGKTLANEVLPRLFIAGAESAVRLSTEISSDEKLQLFIEATGQGVADELMKRLQQSGSLREKEALLYWGESLLRALFYNAGHYTFSSPAKVFETPQDVSALIEATGLTLLDLLFDEESTKIDLKAVFTVESLDLLLRATLEVVAQHPQLISRKDGLRQIIAGVAQALSDSGIQQPGILPELAQLVLRLTAENLDRLWKTGDHPEHLLVTTLEFSLRTLAQPPANGGWKPAFPPGQLLTLLEMLLDEVVSNPEWVLHQIEGHSMLEDTLKSVFAALEVIPSEQRLSLDTAKWVLEQSLMATAASKALLQHLSWGSTEEERTILQEALQVVFAYTFKKGAVSSPEKQELLFDWVDYVLATVLRRQPNRSGVEITRYMLQAFAPLAWHQAVPAEQAMEAALEVLAEHAELVTGEEFVHQLLGGVAEGILHAGIDSPDLLSEIIRLILDYSAQHIDLVLHPAPDDPGNPFGRAVSQALQVLAGAEVVGGFIILSRSQTLELLEIVLLEVAANPQWLEGHALLQRLIASVLDALQHIPGSKPTSNRLVLDLVQLSIEHGMQDLRLLEPLPDEADSPMALAYGLSKLIRLIYDPQWPTSLQWGLHQPQQMAGLCDLFLDELHQLDLTAETIDDLLATYWEGLREFGPSQTFNLDDFMLYIERDIV